MIFLHRKWQPSFLSPRLDFNRKMTTTLLARDVRLIYELYMWYDFDVLCPPVLMLSVCYIIIMNCNDVFTLILQGYFMAFHDLQFWQQCAIGWRYCTTHMVYMAYWISIKLHTWGFAMQDFIIMIYRLPIRRQVIFYTNDGLSPIRPSQLIEPLDVWM